MTLNFSKKNHDIHLERFALALCLAFLFLISIIETANAITFGIGYANPEWKIYDWARLARMFKNISIHSVKFQGVNWGNIEPESPKKGIHNYQWGDLDRLITIFQTEGFTDMEIVLEAGSSWASRKITKNDRLDSNLSQRKDPSLPPQKKYQKDYSDFISNIVERYDGDGNNDMPNLKYPILSYEIETEAQGSHHWLGTAEEYTDLLKVAYVVAKKANPIVQITLTGFWIGDVLIPGEPYEKKIEILDEKMFVKKHWYKYIRFFQMVLKEKNYFDKVEFHSLEDYPSIYTAVEWIRQEMKLNGYEKPIYIGDACATPTLTFGPVKPHPHPFKMEAQEVVKILADRKNVMYKEVNAWYRAEESRLIVKKTAAALEMGLEKINFGLMIDNPNAERVGMKLLATINPLAYNWLIAGIVDSNYQPYPAYFTYKLTVEKLKDAIFIKRLSLGTGLYGFEFSSGGIPIYVLWSEKNAVIDFTVSPPFEAVRITDIVTEFGQQKPVTEQKTAKEGIIKLNLTSNPKFLEPLPNELAKLL